MKFGNQSNLVIIEFGLLQFVGNTDKNKYSGEIHFDYHLASTCIGRL